MLTSYLAMIKRETLEHRNALLWTPIILFVAFNCAFLVFGLSMNDGVDFQQWSGQEQHWSGEERQWSGEETAAEHHRPPTMVEFILFVGVMFATFSVSICVFYALDCLYGDRRDHSILFWRSLPVSEWQNITVKMAMSCAVIPIYFFLVGCATGILGSLLLHVLVGFEGTGSGLTTSIWNFIKCILMILAVSLSLLPVHSALLLVSAVARRSPFFTLIIPLVGLAFLEKLFLGQMVTLPTLLSLIKLCLDNAHRLLRGEWTYSLGGLFTILATSAAFLATTGWIRKRFFEI